MMTTNQKIDLCCWPRTKCPSASVNKEERVILLEENGESVSLSPEQIEILAQFSKEVFEGENDKAVIS